MSETIPQAFVEAQPGSPEQMIPLNDRLEAMREGLNNVDVPSVAQLAEAMAVAYEIDAPSDQHDLYDATGAPVAKDLLDDVRQRVSPENFVLGSDEVSSLAHDAFVADADSLQNRSAYDEYISRLPATVADPFQAYQSNLGRRLTLDAAIKNAFEATEQAGTASEGEAMRVFIPALKAESKPAPDQADAAASIPDQARSSEPVPAPVDESAVRSRTVRHFKNGKLVKEEVHTKLRRSAVAAETAINDTDAPGGRRAATRPQTTAGTAEVITVPAGVLSNAENAAAEEQTANNSHAATVDSRQNPRRATSEQAAVGEPDAQVQTVPAENAAAAPRAGVRERIAELPYSLSARWTVAVRKFAESRAAQAMVRRAQPENTEKLIDHSRRLNAGLVIGSLATGMVAFAANKAGVDFDTLSNITGADVMAAAGNTVGNAFDGPGDVARGVDWGETFENVKEAIDQNIYSPDGAYNPESALLDGGNAGAAVDAAGASAQEAAPAVSTQNLTEPGDNIWNHAEDLFNNHGYSAEFSTVDALKDEILDMNGIDETAATKMQVGDSFEVPALGAEQVSAAGGELNAASAAEAPAESYLSDERSARMQAELAGYLDSGSVQWGSAVGGAALVGAGMHNDAATYKEAKDKKKKKSSKK